MLILLSLVAYFQHKTVSFLGLWYHTWLSPLIFVIVSFTISLFTSSWVFVIGFNSEEFPDLGKNFMFFWSRNLFGIKKEIIIRKTLFHLRDEPILQKYDVAYWSLSFGQYRLPEPFRDITDHTFMLKTVHTKFLYYVVSQTRLSPSDADMLIHQKSIPEKSTIYLSKWKIKESNLNHILHRSNFFFIGVVDSLKYTWSLVCSISDALFFQTSKLWVFSSFFSWSMCIFCSTCIYSQFCQHVVSSSFSYTISD